MHARTRLSIGWSLATLLAAAVLGSQALADSFYLEQGDRHAIGGGFSLSLGDRGLTVHKAGRRAPVLIDGAHPAHAVSVDTRRDGVHLSFMPACDEVAQVYTRQQLAALLDHEEGRRLAQRGKLEEAEAALARAVGLAPLRYGFLLVEVRVKLGKLEEANRALQPIVAASPLQAYVLASSDPTRRPLLELPALAALRAPSPGSAAIDAKTLSLRGWARAPGGVLATVHAESFHGVCYTALSLELRDGASLAPLATFALATGEDASGDGCEQPFTKAGAARVRTRVARANQVLTELGFVPLEAEVAKEPEVKESGTQTARFASDNLGVVVGRDGALRLFRQGKLLLERPAGTIPYEQLVGAIRVPQERRILLFSMEHGCEFAELHAITPVPLP
ncbi:MAG: hypothetical protein R3B48_04710 [Kofleriaceae bacterium]